MDLGPRSPPLEKTNSTARYINSTLTVQRGTVQYFVEYSAIYTVPYGKRMRAAGEENFLVPTREFLAEKLSGVNWCQLVSYGSGPLKKKPGNNWCQLANSGLKNILILAVASGGPGREQPALLLRREHRDQRRHPRRHGGHGQRLRGPAPARRPRAAPSSRPRRCRGGPSSSEEGRAPPRERAAAWPRAELLRDGAEVHLPHLT